MNLLPGILNGFGLFDLHPRNPVFPHLEDGDTATLRLKDVAGFWKAACMSRDPARDPVGPVRGKRDVELVADFLQAGIAADLPPMGSQGFNIRALPIW